MLFLKKKITYILKNSIYERELESFHFEKKKKLHHHYGKMKITFWKKKEEDFENVMAKSFQKS